MKLSAVIQKLQQAFDEHGDLDVVYPSMINSDYLEYSCPEPVEEDQFYLGYVDPQKTRVRAKPINPLTDKPVYVIE